MVIRLIPDKSETTIDRPVRYTTRLAQVVAARWDPGDLGNAGMVVGWLMAAAVGFHHPSGAGATTTLAIHRPGRPDAVAAPGDWIVRTERGWTVCTPELFEVVFSAGGGGLTQYPTATAMT